MHNLFIIRYGEDTMPPLYWSRLEQGWTNNHSLASLYTVREKENTVLPLGAKGWERFLDGAAP